jgi:GxxExxY protein
MNIETGAIDGLTERVIGCAIEVHRTLGPGRLEAIYRECLLLELNAAHLVVESGRRVPVLFKGERLNSWLVVDVLVQECLVVELKAVEKLQPLYQAQLITYLKLTGCPAGLLMNFNATTLRAGLKPVVRPDLYVPKDVNRDTT